jgi:hypothetical protein
MHTQNYCILSQVSIILKITVNRFNNQSTNSPIFILRLSLTHHDDTEIDVLTSLDTEELFIP